MRHQSAVKEKVRQLRTNGFSLGQIYEETKIPVTTIRSWISDIELSKEQQEVLRRRIQTALQQGRIRAQKAIKDQRIKKESEMLLEGRKEIGKLTPRELFIAGVALYWAEGFKNKHEHRLGFCNSDPKMIKFYIKWLGKILNIKRESLIARLTLNSSYKDKTREIEEHWSKLTGIPLSQFTKPFYQNTLWKKQFNTDNYKGVLRIHVKDSLGNLLKMRGWLEGLSDLCYTGKRARVAQLVRAQDS